MIHNLWTTDIDIDSIDSIDIDIDIDSIDSIEIDIDIDSIDSIEIDIHIDSIDSIDINIHEASPVKGWQFLQSESHLLQPRAHISEQTKISKSIIWKYHSTTKFHLVQITPSQMEV